MLETISTENIYRIQCFALIFTWHVVARYAVKDCCSVIFNTLVLTDWTMTVATAGIRLFNCFIPGVASSIFVYMLLALLVEGLVTVAGGGLHAQPYVARTKLLIAVFHLPSAGILAIFITASGWNWGEKPLFSIPVTVVIAIVCGIVGCICTQHGYCETPTRKIYGFLKWES